MKMIILIFIIVSNVFSNEFKNKDLVRIYGSLSLGIKNDNIELYRYGNVDKSIDRSGTNIILPLSTITRKLNDFSIANFKIGLNILDLLFIESLTENYQYLPKDNTINFRPFQTNYKFKAFLKYEFIELGWEHLCIHSVTPHLYSDVNNTIKIGGGGNKFYIKTKFNVTLIK